MTISELANMYPNDPQKIVYHGVHPTPCYRPERAGTPIGHGIFHATRYKLVSGIEVNLNKISQVEEGLELEIGFEDHNEQFLIPAQDAGDFLQDMNLNIFQKFVMALPSWIKPNYRNLKLTAFQNIYNENKLFGLIALIKYGENEHLYKDRRNNIFFINYPQGIGIGNGKAEFCGDPDVTDWLTQFYDRKVIESLNSF